MGELAERCLSCIDIISDGFRNYFYECRITMLTSDQLVHNLEWDGPDPDPDNSQIEEHPEDYPEYWYYFNSDGDVGLREYPENSKFEHPADYFEYKNYPDSDGGF